MRYIIFLASAFAMAIFINTAPPTIFLGDSGEIAAAAYTLGIPHPPGYPLDMLLGKISMLLPLGDMAFRMNILSSLLAVICFIFLYLAGVEFLNLVFRADAGKKGLKFTALLVSLMFLFSSMFWFEGIHAKGAVYVLANMLMSMGAFLTLKNIATKKSAYFYASAYVLGFMLPAHNATALYAAFLGIILLYSNIKPLNMKKFAIGAAFFALSITTSYLYLFYRAGTGTPVNFGYLKTFSDVVTHISRKAYEKHYTAAFDMGAYFAKIGYCAGGFVEKYNVLAVFLLAGLYYLYTFSKKISAFVLGFMALNTALLIYVINTSAGFSINSLSSISLYASKNFYLMNDMAPVIVSMAGLYMLFKAITGKYGINAVFTGAVLSVALVLMIAVNYQLNNFSRTFMAYDHGVNINKSLKDGDIVWVKGDCPLFNMVYLQSVKGAFKGIKTYDRDANMLDPSIFAGLKERPQSAINKVELNTFKANPLITYYTGISNFADENIFTLPYGIIFKMAQAGVTTVGTLPLAKVYAFRDYFNNDNQDLYYRDVSARYFVMRGRYAGLEGNREEADKWLKLALKTAGTSPEILNGLATIYYFNFGDVNTAIDYERKIYELDPSDSTAITLLIGLFKQVNPSRCLEYLNVLLKRSTDETEKANIKLEIDGINNSLKPK